MSVPGDPPCIPGLFLMAEFLAPEEEQDIISRVDAAVSNWVTMSKRRVQHYGYSFK